MSYIVVEWPASYSSTSLPAKKRLEKWQQQQEHKLAGKEAVCFYVVVKAARLSKSTAELAAAAEENGVETIETALSSCSQLQTSVLKELSKSG